MARHEEGRAVRFDLERNSIHFVPREDDSRCGSCWLYLAGKRKGRKEKRKAKSINKKRKEGSKDALGDGRQGFEMQDDKGEILFVQSNGLFLG